MPLIGLVNSDDAEKMALHHSASPEYRFRDVKKFPVRLTIFTSETGVI